MYICLIESARTVLPSYLSVFSPIAIAFAVDGFPAVAVVSSVTGVSAVASCQLLALLASVLLLRSLLLLAGVCVLQLAFLMLLGSFYFCIIVVAGTSVTTGNLVVAGFFIPGVVAAGVHVVAGVLAVAGFFAGTVCLCCFLSLYCWQPCCCASTGAEMTSLQLSLPALAS